LQSPDRFTGIRGLAGTGKSTALSELARAIREAGCECVFCAPTGSASDVLRKDGFDAITLQRLFVDPKLQASLNQQSVLVLDEAGAVSVDEMQRLFSLAVGHGARVVLSGDTGQHASVSRGDALRILEQHSRYSFGQLSTIRRQRRADYLQAVTLAAERQPTRAFDRLNAMGEIIEQSAGLCERTAAAYLDAINGGGTALIVSPTWTEIESVTHYVREALKVRGIIGGKEWPAASLIRLHGRKRKSAASTNSGQDKCWFSISKSARSRGTSRRKCSASKATAFNCAVQMAPRCSSGFTVTVKYETPAVPLMYASNANCASPPATGCSCKAIGVNSG
jgi:hypothetical protein